MRKIWFERFMSSFNCCEGYNDAWQAWLQTEPGCMTSARARLICEAARAEAERRASLPPGQFFKRAKSWLLSRGWEDYEQRLKLERQRELEAGKIPRQQDAIAEAISDDEYEKACVMRKRLEAQRQAGAYSGGSGCGACEAGGSAGAGQPVGAALFRQGDGCRADSGAGEETAKAIHLQAEPGTASQGGNVIPFARAGNVAARVLARTAKARRPANTPLRRDLPPGESMFIKQKKIRQRTF